MSPSGEITQIKSLNREELVAGVIQKHRRFLDEYKLEFEELDKKIVSLNEQIASAKQNRDEAINRTEVLKEKRQQLYHQAEHLLEEAVGGAGSGIDHKSLSSVRSWISDLKSAKVSDNEGDLNRMVMEKLSSMPANVQSMVSQIKVRLDDAHASTVELASITGSDVAFDEEHVRLNNELKEVDPRHKWLGNRINSHTEAVKYWEGLDKAADDQGVVSA